MKKQNRINKSDSLIFGSLYRAQRPLPVKRIATRTGLSWPTVQSSVKKLEKFGVLNTQKTVRRTNVSLEPSFLNSLRKLNKGRR